MAEKKSSSNCLRVRVYNVRFGDAILVSIPDENVLRHILIDVGNVQAGEGGDPAVFGPVVNDVRKQLKGRPLDLYVMTHEHMDHVKGLPYADGKLDLGLDVKYSWLTASAAPDYYKRFPDAKKLRLQAIAALEAARMHLQAAPNPRVDALLLNNDYRSTEKCVKHLRNLGKTTTYVYRDIDLRGTHAFTEARFRIWGPEEDTSEYYGRFQPFAAFGFGSMSTDGNAGGQARQDPPPGVDARAFYNLVDSRAHGNIDNLLTIDKAANNTSVVFSIEWRGWKLLFPGDAEIRSWKTMAKYDVLEPVHFLKVGHHGSYNGTPDDDILERILPERPPDGRRRTAVVSTYLDVYSGVPDDATIETLEARCDLRSTLELDDELFFDVYFEA